jgi:predicted pyridoxine 5'-phosphate oxidase superfamily flavin-nucleotide-binding protein
MTRYFHEGELAVQRRAGVEDVAQRVGAGNLGNALGPDLDDFLAEQPFVVVASTDGAGRVWASLLVGDPGFARVLDERRLLLAALPLPDDPLAAALELEAPRLGVLAIDPLTRTRIRINGRAERVDEGVVVAVEEAFGNCQKYIQRRAPVAPMDLSARGTAHRSGTALAADQRALVSAADTFYIASAHAERGADASHRGGGPGFVEVAADGAWLRFPDYQGNRMFQTLGNLTVDPRSGLLFIDWQTGTTLQVSGRAQIVWDADEVALRPGAQRLVAVDIDAVHEHERALPAPWLLIEPSRVNPPVRA